MAKIYADLIIKGAINPKTNAAYVLEDVPSALREKVRKIIEENGVTE